MHVVCHEMDDESDEEREVRFIFQTARLRLNAMAPDSEQNCPRELLYLDEEEISNDEDDAFIDQALFELLRQ